jgi:hypothetical protein
MMRRYRAARRRNSSGGRASTTWHREELIPSVFYYKLEEIEYEISGNVTPGSPGSYEEPPEGPEVEIIDIVREGKSLPPNKWDFSDKEMEDMQERLYEHCDDYWGEPDYDEDCDD